MAAKELDEFSFFFYTTPEKDKEKLLEDTRNYGVHYVEVIDGVAYRIPPEDITGGGTCGS